MPPSYSINLPVLSLRILDDSYSFLFPFRKWKTNAFCKRHDSANRPEIIIRFSRCGYIPMQPEKLIFQSAEGFSYFQIHGMSKNRLLFTMQKANSDFVYLQYLFNIEENEIILTEDRTDTVVRFLPALFLKADTILLHGVLLEHNGRGIILSAPSGVGKTTHAHLWQEKKDALILNGDLSACYKKNVEDESVWTGFGMPWCGTSGEYINREVPISAIIVLDRSENNEAIRLDLLPSFSALYSQLKLPVWDKSLAEKGTDLLLEMLVDIPVFYLKCRPDAESVEVLDRALMELK